MANDKNDLANNVDFWNWLQNRAKEESYKPLELTIDAYDPRSGKPAQEDSGNFDISKEFEISHDVSFEISGNVVYELGRS